MELADTVSLPGVDLPRMARAVDGAIRYHWTLYRAHCGKAPEPSSWIDDSGKHWKQSELDHPQIARQHRFALEALLPIRREALRGQVRHVTVPVQPVQLEMPFLVRVA